MHTCSQIYKAVCQFFSKWLRSTNKYDILQVKPLADGITVQSPYQWNECESNKKTIKTHWIV